MKLEGLNLWEVIYLAAKPAAGTDHLLDCEDCQDAARQIVSQHMNNADSDAAQLNASSQHAHTTPRVGCVKCGLGFTPYEGDTGTPPEALTRPKFDSSAGASGTIPANW